MRYKFKKGDVVVVCNPHWRGRDKHDKGRKKFKDKIGRITQDKWNDIINAQKYPFIIYFPYEFKYIRNNRSIGEYIWCVAELRKATKEEIKLFKQQEIEKEI